MTDILFVNINHTIFANDYTFIIQKLLFYTKILETLLYKRCFQYDSYYLFCNVTHASIKFLKIGCGRFGRDKNSGWN